MATIKSLSIVDPVNSELRAAYRVQYARCNEAIRIANSEGKKNAAVDLPVIFAILGMNNKDAQCYVYSNLIDRFRDDGFTVDLKINREKVTATICFSWISKTYKKDITEMKATILSAMRGT